MQPKRIQFDFAKGSVTYSFNDPKSLTYSHVPVCDADGKYKGRKYKWLVKVSHDGYDQEFYSFATVSTAHAARMLKKLVDYVGVEKLTEQALQSQNKQGDE